jgi:hypothetical protein
VILLGFFNENGSALLIAVMGSITAILGLWNFAGASEVQKYFGTTLLLMIPMFFVLLLYIDCLNEKTKKNIQEDIQRLKTIPDG